jgi:hypothetical protein
VDGVHVTGDTCASVDIRSLSTLPSPDYCDLYTITTATAGDLSPEGWARALLEQAPLSRRSAYRLWRLLGLRLGPPGSPDHVQGWRIADRGSDWIRIESGSWYLTAQAVLRRDRERVSVSLFLGYDHPVAALVWAPVGVLHRRAVPVMLRQAVERQEARCHVSVRARKD